MLGGRQLHGCQCRTADDICGYANTRVSVCECACVSVLTAASENLDRTSAKYLERVSETGKAMLADVDCLARNFKHLSANGSTGRRLTGVHVYHRRSDMHTHRHTGIRTCIFIEAHWHAGTLAYGHI